MNFLARTRELGSIRTALDRPESSILRVSGLRGIGKTTLVRRATDGFERVECRIPPLPEARQIEALARACGTPAEGAAAGWAGLFEGLAARAPETGGQPLVLILDDAHNLDDSRARWLEPLTASLRGIRSRARSMHVVLSGAERGLPPDDILAELEGGSIQVGPLDFRAAAPMLPGSDARDLIRAYGVFGGIPGVLKRLDNSVTLDTNIRRLVLDPDGPLADVGQERLEGSLQSPTRYYAIMDALSTGEADWGRVHEGVADLTASGQVAPYLQRLQELGFVRTRRSLDARPRSRSTRYSITDPFLAFWFRFVFPLRFGTVPEDPTEYYNALVRPTLDDHMASVFPDICRQYMASAAIESLGSNAREIGGLWGSGYDLPVAGILGSGAAFYGHCSWQGYPAGATPIGSLDSEIRETRYGFGRQARLRVLFTGRPLSRGLQRAALRREDTVVIGPDDLSGHGGESS